MPPRARSDTLGLEPHADDLPLTSLLLAKRDALQREAAKLGDLVAGIRQAQEQGRSAEEINALFAEYLTPAAGDDTDDGPAARRFTTHVDGTRVERACWDLTISAYRGGPHDSAIELDEVDWEHIADAVREGGLEGELVIERAPDGFVEAEPHGPTPAQDVDFDQVGTAWARRFVRALPGGRYAVVDASFYVRDDAEGIVGPARLVMTRQLDYTLCDDPTNPTAHTVWSGTRTNDVPVADGALDAEHARRLCTEFDPSSLTWDGRPTRTSRPLPVPPVPAAPDADATE